ncbi:MAG: dCMP deaminase family protein [Alphaproteobacteria bacterium]|nr:dCMP deaminase family protein [Alphaproteobacteria bacterium]
MDNKTGFTFTDKWNYRFMQMAQFIATWSKDNSTKVGCVIVSPNKTILSMGYNGFPRGIDDNVPTRWQRPTKYDFVVHAEENALLNAGRNGTRLDGGILYATMAPCTRCAGSIIQSGIREIIYLDPDLDRQIPGWRDSLGISFQMFDEAGINYKSLGTAQDMMKKLQEYTK